MSFKQYTEEYSFGISKPVTIVSPDVTIGWKQHVQISPVISMGALAVKTAIGFAVQSDSWLKLKKDPNIFQERITYSFKNNRITSLVAMKHSKQLLLKKSDFKIRC